MRDALRTATKAVKQLYRFDQQNIIRPCNVVLIFDMSMEDTKRCAGYNGFMTALQQAGGELTEDNIQQACLDSGLKRASVIDKPVNERIVIHTSATATQLSPLKHHCT